MHEPRLVALTYAGTASVLAAIAVLGDDLTRAVTVAVAALLAFSSVASSARRHPQLPRPMRLAYRFMLVGLAVLTLHDGQAVLSRMVTGLEPLGDVFAGTLALGYVCLLAGGVMMTIPHAGRDTGSLLDAAIIAIVVTSIAWVLIVQPRQAATGVPPRLQLYELVVLLLVGGMAGAAIRAASLTTRAQGSVTSLVIASAGAYLGHVTAILSYNPVTGDDSPWIDAWWVVAYLGMGAAFAHPSVPHLGTHHGREARLTRRRLVYLGLALSALPAMIAIGEFVRGDHAGALLAVGSALLVPLVLARIANLATWHARAERRLMLLATVDELTGLPNRRAISAHLDRLLARVAAHDAAGAVVLFLDLDDFKIVNDEHGHATGDLLLVEVSRRLRAAVRSTDLVGRFGGDEFVVVLEGPPAETRSTATAALARALAEPVVLEGHGGLEASARASVGAALVSPGEHVSAEHVLSTADAAMYVVKRQHRAGVQTR